MRNTHINLAYYCLFILAALLAPVPSSASDQNQSRIAKLGEQKCSVHVTNGLGTRNLLAHCKSKDDDLGIRYVSVGSEFSWGFKMNFIGTTLYWCYLAPDTNSHVSMKVFWNNRNFTSKCDNFNCCWVAKDDGVYLRNFPRNIEEFFAAWQPGRLN
eukprot:XP_015576599.1 S-protein homolog 74-like [Ricinus communis]